MKDDLGKNPTPELEWQALWSAAYQRYVRLWINLARSADIPFEEARDVVQNVVAGIIAEPSRRFESLEHARNYVAKSVLNRAKGYKSRMRKRTPWEDVVESKFAVLEEEFAGDEKARREELRSAIRALSKKDFDILKMRFYGGYTLAQTSKLLGMPISTIASREAAILRKIRIRLHKKGF